MACLDGEVLTQLGCIPTNPAGFAQKFYGIGLGVIGGLAVVFIIIGGYILLTSRGNPQQVRTGKEFIVYAILGLFLAIFGYIIIQTLLIDILHIPGISR